MNDELTKDLDNLSKAESQHSADIIPLTMNRLLEMVESKKDAIDDIINKFSKKGERDSALFDLISSYIDQTFASFLAVPVYLQRSKSKQDMYVFVGTHWKLLFHQQTIDFFRDCCKKMGLHDSLCGNFEFMNPLIEEIGFRRSRHIQSNTPADEVWINMQNGTLEIHADGSVTFREHRAEDFFTYCLSYSYDEKETCPLWHKFLDEVMPEKEMQMVLAEYIGYCFTKNMKLEKMAVFYGTGCNGKSVTMDMIEQIVGKENVSHVSLSAATMDEEQRIHLDRKLVNISPESNKNLDTACLKQLVSGEPVNVRKLYVGSYVIYDYAKLITSFNQLPPTERTFGYFRRWLLFPFKVTITEDKQDINLAHKLTKELPGIMNWVLEGLKRLTNNATFTNSPACNQALNDYQKNSNSGLSFLSERCEIDNAAYTKLKDLYSAYCTYCSEEGITNRMIKKNFKSVIESFGIDSKIIHNGEYFGVKIIKYED